MKKASFFWSKMLVLLCLLGTIVLPGCHAESLPAYAFPENFILADTNYIVTPIDVSARLGEKPRANKEEPYTLVYKVPGLSTEEWLCLRTGTYTSSLT